MYFPGPSEYDMTPQEVTQWCIDVTLEDIDELRTYIDLKAIIDFCYDRSPWVRERLHEQEAKLHYLRTELQIKTELPPWHPLSFQGNERRQLELDIAECSEEVEALKSQREDIVNKTTAAYWRWLKIRAAMNRHGRTRRCR